jgi:hypothetical protein
MSYAESEARTQQSAELFLTAAARDNAWNFLRRRATKDGTFFDNGLRSRDFRSDALSTTAE